MRLSTSLSISRLICIQLFRLYAIGAFILPALIPAGYMIGRNPTSNLVEITICSVSKHDPVFIDLDSGRLLDPSENQMQMALQSDASQHPGSASRDQEQVGQICPFALASGALLLSVNHLDVATARVSVTPSLSLPPGPAVSHSHAPLPARGPPIPA